MPLLPKKLASLLLCLSLLIPSLVWGSPSYAALLSESESAMARQAWGYFAKNINVTGLANSVDGYPSATLWEQGNLAVALVAAQELGIITTQERDHHLNELLRSLETLPLFENALPNKAYNTATLEKTDYGNTPVPRGIGFSGLDLGRLINALLVVKTNLPPYRERIDRLIQGWDLDRLYQRQDLYGAVVLPDGQTLAVQEGRHGYLEYAARSGVILGREMAQALNPPVALIDVFGIPIKNDTRHFRELNAVAYTVTEAPALEIIELGVQGRPQVWEEFCSLYAAQKRRWQSTGLWTAATEDHISGRLFPDTPFLYNTVVSDGIPWAVVTEGGQRFDERRTISTKAAVLLSVLQPSDDPLAYGNRVLEIVQPLFDDGGYFAGQFERSQEINDILTNNTNGILLEALWAKQRGQSLITNESFPTTCGEWVQSSELPPNPSGMSESQGTAPLGTLLGLAPEHRLSPGGAAPLHQFHVPSRCQVVQTTPQGPLSLNPLPALPGGIQPSRCASTSLSPTELGYAQAAWNYFQHFRDPQTGLVPTRSDMRATTLWGLGDTVAAMGAAERLGLISPEDVDAGIRKLLGTLRVLPTVEGLPHLAYAVGSGQPVNLGGVPELPSEWDGTGIARLAVALAAISECHPEYQQSIEDLLLQWRYYALIHAGSLYSGQSGQPPRLECSFYSSYAIAGMNRWGFRLQAPTFQQQQVNGHSLSVGCDRVLTSDPLLYQALEIGLNPTLKSQLKSYWQAQTLITGSATVALATPPYWVRNTLWAGSAGVIRGLDGNSYPQLASVSTGAAFAWWAMGDPEASLLRAEVIQRTLTNPSQGFEDGYVLRTGNSVGVRTSHSNFMVLAALVYQDQGSLLKGFQPSERWQKRGWWLGG